VKFSTKETEWLKHITSRIQHENLILNIPLYYSDSYCEDNMRAYLITTHIPYSIEEYLASKGAKKNDPLALEIAAKMISNVESLHKLRYIHRDLNPSSFRVNENGEVYLKNFENVVKYVDDNGDHIDERFGDFVA
jgi:serine/threonine protein kinase